MCLLHVIKKLKADRVWGLFNTEGTHSANSHQIKQDYLIRVMSVTRKFSVVWDAPKRDIERLQALERMPTGHNDS